MLAFGAFSLDVAAEQLRKHDTLLPLRRKPFAILSFLSANPRRLVTHAELIEHEGLIETVIG